MVCWKQICNQYDTCALNAPTLPPWCCCRSNIPSHSPIITAVVACESQQPVCICRARRERMHWHRSVVHQSLLFSHSGCAHTTCILHVCNRLVLVRTHCTGCCCFKKKLKDESNYHVQYLGTEISVSLPVWRCLLGRTVQDGVVKRLATEGETCWDDMCTWYEFRPVKASVRSSGECRCTGDEDLMTFGCKSLQAIWSRVKLGGDLLGDVLGRFELNHIHHLMGLGMGWYGNEYVIELDCEDRRE